MGVEGIDKADVFDEYFNNIEIGPITIKDFSKLLKVSQITLRTWLGNFRFSKYRNTDCRPATYTVNKEFLLELKNYINNKSSIAAHRTYNYIDRLLRREE